MYNNGATKQVYDYIVKKIQTRELKTGDKVMSENELVSTLGVSRTAVRMAMEQLVGVGMITRKQGSGTYVSKLGTKDAIKSVFQLVDIKQSDFIDIQKFRIGFETTNIEFLEKTLTQETIDELESLYRLMQETKDDLYQFFEYDYKFHQTIAEATKNSFVIRISILIMGFLRSQQATLYQTIGPANGLRFHKLIIDDLKARDFEVAKIHMKRHMIESINEYLERKAVLE